MRVMCVCVCVRARENLHSWQRRETRPAQDCCHHEVLVLLDRVPELLICLRQQPTLHCDRCNATVAKTDCRIFTNFRGTINLFAKLLSFTLEVHMPKFIAIGNNWRHYYGTVFLSALTVDACTIGVKSLKWDDSDVILSTEVAVTIL